MTHWHILSINERKEIVAAVRYDNAAKSVGDYVDLAYSIFGKLLEESDRSTYMTNMLRLTEEFEGYHIYTTSRKLNLSWTDCDDDPCSFAAYN